MISRIEYKIISDSLGEMYFLASWSTTQLDTMLEDLENTAVPSGKGSQFTAISTIISSTSKQVQKEQVTLTDPLRNVVVELQKLLLTGYDSVDDFLESNGVTVTAGFASLSGACGYPISLSNVLLD